MYFFSALLLAGFLFRLWLSGFGGIHPDEAYYWDWSKNLHWGYFDHPPMVAWIIALGDRAFRLLMPHSLFESDPIFWTQVSFRWLPVLMGSVLTPLALGRCIEMIQKKQLRVLQMIALMTAPIFALGPQLVSPDTPLMWAWCLGLLYTLKLQRVRDLDSFPGDPTPFRLSYALRLGLIITFAAYSKYSAFLLAFLIVATGAGLYNSLVAGSVTLALLTPHLIWNFNIGQAIGGGVFFQLVNRAGNILDAPNYRRAGDLIASQMAIWTPLVFFGSISTGLANVRRIFSVQRKTRLNGTLLLWALVPVLFFSLVALRRNAEANWPLMGVCAALVLIVSRFYRSPFWLIFLSASQVVVMIIGAIIFVNNKSLATFVEGFNKELASKLAKPSRTGEFTGWDQVRQTVFDLTQESPDVPILVQSYQLLSVLKFYDAVALPPSRLGTRLKFWAVGSRPSQYLLEPGDLPSNEIQKYWLMIRQKEEIPKNCRMSRPVFKGRDFETFSIYSCGF